MNRGSSDVRSISTSSTKTTRRNSMLSPTSAFATVGREPVRSPPAVATTSTRAMFSQKPPSTARCKTKATSPLPPRFRTTKSRFTDCCAIGLGSSQENLLVAALRSMLGPSKASDHDAIGSSIELPIVSNGLPAESEPETQTSTIYEGRSVVAPASVKSRLPVQKNCSPNGVVSGRGTLPREISASPARTL